MKEGKRNAVMRFTVLAGLAAILLIALPARSQAGDLGCGEAGAAPRQATLHQLRTSTLCLINRLRRRYGIASLHFNEDLFRSATGHSNDMVHSGYFSHFGSRGSTLTGRVGRAGYLTGAGFYFVGENIGGGPGRLGSPIEVFRSWLHSPPHRANMLDPKFHDFGVGVALGYPAGDGTGATYTLDVGTRR